MQVLLCFDLLSLRFSFKKIKKLHTFLRNFKLKLLLSHCVFVFLFRSFVFFFSEKEEYIAQGAGLPESHQVQAKVPWTLQPGNLFSMQVMFIVWISTNNADGFYLC